MQKLSILPVKWSPQQTAFMNAFENSKGGVTLVARAGTGKSTTAIGAIALSSKTNIAFMAFNADVAKENKDKLAALGIDWKKAQAGTCHSFGFRALGKLLGNPKVDENKVSNLVGRDTPFANVICQLVSKAKDFGIGLPGQPKIDDMSAWLEIMNRFDLIEDEEGFDASAICEIAALTLKKSNALTSVIDFGDMIYLALLLPVRFWKFDHIIIDEAQDTNVTRRMLVGAMLNRGGRVFPIGDDKQAIYAFTGADSDSLDLLTKKFHTVKMPLNVTRRCGKAIVRFANQWVDDIAAHESNIEGKVLCDKPVNIDTVTPDYESAILCRNTAPLVKACFKLIRRKIAAKVMGRDIEKGLVKIINKWKTVKTIDAFANRLDVWFKQQSERHKDNEKHIGNLTDQFETLKVIIEQAQAEGKTQREDLVTVISTMFGECKNGELKGVVVLSTIHKSKGKEWKNVYWLNRAKLNPSPYAKKDFEQEQEINLMYVAATRAKELLQDIEMD